MAAEGRPAFPARAPRLLARALALSQPPSPLLSLSLPGALYLLVKGALYFAHSVLASPWVASRLVGG
jgi:hypothetical protein